MQIDVHGITGDNQTWEWNDHSVLDAIRVENFIISKQQVQYCMGKTIRSRSNNTDALSGPVYILEDDRGQTMHLDEPLYCVSVVAGQDAWHHTLTLFQGNRVRTAVLSATNGKHATSLCSLLERNDYGLDLIFLCLPSPKVYQAYKKALATCGNLKVSVASLSEHKAMSVARYLCTSTKVGIVNVSNRETVVEGWVGKDVFEHRGPMDVFAQTTLVLQNKVINPGPWSRDVTAIPPV